MDINIDDILISYDIRKGLVIYGVIDELLNSNGIFYFCVRRTGIDSFGNNRFDDINDHKVYIRIDKAEYLTPNRLNRDEINSLIIFLTSKFYDDILINKYYNKFWDFLMDRMRIDVEFFDNYFKENPSIPNYMELCDE